MKHDRFLCKKTFPNFVDSWNYISNKVENLKGDADIISQYGCGHIHVDNSDPEHPVIRCVNLPKGGSGAVDVDTDIAANPDSNSIQKVTQSYGDYIQLLNFASDQRKTPSETSGTDDFLFREKKYISQEIGYQVNLEYMGKQYVINPVTDNASLEPNGTYQGQVKWQLYNFDDLTYDIPFGCLGSGDSFVIRHNDVVDYVPALDLKVLPDAEVGCTFSIEGCGTSPKELRLYNWLGSGYVYGDYTTPYTFFDLCEYDNYDVLVRNRGCADGYTLNYMNLRNLSRFADNDINGTTTKSIDTTTQAGKVDFTLHDFAAPTVHDCGIRLKYDGCAYHITSGNKSAENKQILVRNGTNVAKELEYWDFTIVAPKIGCGDVDEGLWEEIESSHCDCGSKWDEYYTWRGEIDEMLGRGSGAGCFWKTYGDTSTCTAHEAWVGSMGVASIEVQNGATFGSSYISSGAGELYIDSSITIGSSTRLTSGCANIGCNCISDGYVGFAYNIDAGCGVTIGCGHSLTIGCTSLNETQLQQLLRLL